MERPQEIYQARVKLAALLMGAAFVVLVGRLWYLQIVQGAYFRDRSENNRMREIFVPAPRGLIVDRNGRILARNRASFTIELVVEDCPNVFQTITRLADVLGRDATDLMERLRRQRARRRFEPQMLLHDVSRDDVARVAAHRFELPGVVVNVNPAREYLDGELAAHTIGYTREISAAQLQAPRFSTYRHGDVVGQFALESAYEEALQGERGSQTVIVNAFGTRIGEAGFAPEIPGRDVQLTLDYDVQRAAHEALGGKGGAIVALDPRTGELLALVSHPAFDPNDFVGELDPETWRQIVGEGGRASKLLNRAVQGGYAPGSVFKIMTAAAALGEGVTTPQERVFCNGGLFFGSREFKCHKRTGHGSTNLYEALVQSCDVYFYTMGQRLGVDRIHDYATRFGLGMLTGIGLWEENRGVIPSTEWKRRSFRRREDQQWYPGETLSVVIGQGAVVVTPLQLARAVAALVNGGRLLRPRIVRSVGQIVPAGQADTAAIVEDGSLGIAPDVIDTVRQALVGVVADPKGTGSKASLAKEFGISVGGKTGTAQVISLSSQSDEEHHGDHAWFVAYAPAEEPEIVVVTLVEHAGHGGAEAAPRTKQVMEAFFRKRLGQQVQALAGGPVSIDGIH